MIDFEQLPVTITYVGQTRLDDDWDGDQWSVKISGQGGYWTTNYYTGLGWRDAKTKRPTKPKVIDVLHSLFLDATAADYNFDDWCATYGYNNDSIKALNIYKQCLDTATRLRKYFTKEQRDAIEEAVAQM